MNTWLRVVEVLCAVMHIIVQTQLRHREAVCAAYYYANSASWVRSAVGDLQTEPATVKFCVQPCRRHFTPVKLCQRVGDATSRQWSMVRPAADWPSSLWSCVCGWQCGFAELKLQLHDRERNFAAAEPICIFPTVLHGTEVHSDGTSRSWSTVNAAPHLWSCVGMIFPECISPLSNTECQWQCQLWQWPTVDGSCEHLQTAQSVSVSVICERFRGVFTAPLSVCHRYRWQTDSSVGENWWPPILLSVPVTRSSDFFLTPKAITLNWLFIVNQ